MRFATISFFNLLNARKLKVCAENIIKFKIIKKNTPTKKKDCKKLSRIQKKKKQNYSKQNKAVKENIKNNQNANH